MTLPVFINAFGWALLHSLWQAALIFLALHISLRIFRNAPSHLKYILAYSAMAGIFLCFLLTFYTLWNSQQAIQQITVAPSAGAVAAEGLRDYALSPGSSSYHLINPALWINYFVLLYAAGFIFFVGKIIRDFFAMRRIRHARITPFDKAWEHYLDKLCAAWEIKKRVQLFLSEYIDVPVVIGYLKPVIYLPLITVTQLSPQQIEAVLLHELAHIKRFDFIANIFQTLIETILFFNPFVWLISKIIRRERENSCDDLVLSATQPALYAETLLALAENQLYKGNFVLAAAGKKQQLFHRIKRIMEMKTKKLNIMQKLLVLFILAAGIISVSWLIPDKKTAQQKETVKITPHFYSNKEADTNLLPATPVPPLTIPAAPPLTAPVPAPPERALAAIDTFPNNFLNDSSIKNVQLQMRQYFKSEAWRKYQQDLQSYQQNIQQYFQSKEWRKHLEEMNTNMDSLRQRLSRARLNSEMFNNQEMKKDMDSLRQRLSRSRLNSEMFNDQEMKKDMDSLRQRLSRARLNSEMFNNQEIKKDMDSLRQRLSRARFSMDSLMGKNRFSFSFDKARMDSLMATEKRKWALEKRNYPRMFLFSNGHTVNPNEIVSMMKSDGLIKNDHNFSIKINDKGLYINGKKQSQASFEKYRNIIGTDTQLEIKKQGTHLKSSINSEEKDNNSSL